MNRVFVTGTDTGVGKTLVSEALIHFWVNQGYKTAGFKPVASGADWINGELQNEDARALLAASNLKLKYADVNPCVFQQATAPHIAARQNQSVIDISQLDSACERLSHQCEKMVIEGAGGWQVPLVEQFTFADWVGQKQWPVILVINIKLGCINHAYLTYRDICQYGNVVSGWVANLQCQETPFANEMIETINHFIGPPLLGILPCLASAEKSDVLQYLDFFKLQNYS